MGYQPIQLSDASGHTLVQYKAPEAATQTFKLGVPVKLDGSGNLVEADGTWSAADVLYGISAEAAHNLTTAGTAQGGTSEGTPQNQTGSIIAHGAWPKDGLLANYHLDGLNNFYIALLTGQTFTQALVLSGTYYKILKDSGTGFWYLDSLTTSGNGAVAEIIGVDPNDNTRVKIRFKGSQRYF